MKYALKIFHVLRLVLIERLIYRVNFALEILSGILSSLIIVLLWMAIFRSSDQPLIGGYTLAEMVTYLLGGGLINSLILTTAENPEASRSIQDGSLSFFLIQPLSPYWLWFFRDLGSKLFYFFLGLLGYLAVIFFFRAHLLWWASRAHFLFFLLSLLLASLLQFFLFEGLSLLSFWVENTYGIRFTMRVILEVVGGAIIPLSFFPLALQKIFLWLPFPYVVYLPMRIYLGKISLEEVQLEIVREIFWIAALAMVNLVLWRKGVHHYVSMGD